MKRYLLHVSYLGTRFKGVQRIAPYYNRYDVSTVQGAIESHLSLVKGVKYVEIDSSSRTDARVHAFDNPFIADVKTDSDIDIKPETITSQLNRKFFYKDIDIRVHHTEEVANDFDQRGSVECRTYLYRLAIAKTPLKRQILQENANVSFEDRTVWIPAEEINRVYHITNQPGFDMEKMKRICSLFVGHHDFQSFMKWSKEERNQVAGFAKRKIISCSIEPSQPTVFACNYDKAVETYDYWTVIIKARSFVYRQVRNMIAIMVECATGKLSEREFYEMLTIPSNRNWPKNLETAPAHGLYLKNVEFGSPEEPPEEDGQSQVKEI